MHINVQYGCIFHTSIINFWPNKVRTWLFHFPFSLTRGLRRAVIPNICFVFIVQIQLVRSTWVAHFYFDLQENRIRMRIMMNSMSIYKNYLWWLCTFILVYDFNCWAGMLAIYLYKLKWVLCEHYQWKMTNLWSI